MDTTPKETSPWRAKAKLFPMLGSLLVVFLRTVIVSPVRGIAEENYDNMWPALTL